MLLEITRYFLNISFLRTTKHTKQTCALKTFILLITFHNRIINSHFTSHSHKPIPHLSGYYCMINNTHSIHLSISMLREDLPVYNYTIMTLKKHFIRKKSRQTKSVRTAAGGFSVGGQSFMKS